MQSRSAKLIIGCAAILATITVASAQRGGGGGGGGFGGGGFGGPGGGVGGARGAPPPDQDERTKPKQDDTPTFRSRVTIVQVDALVTDAAGNPVKGLTEKDFEVTEAGKPRQITSFSAVDIPLPTESTTGIGLESDMVTNGTPPGRTYLLALDEVDPQNAVRARHFLRDFIEKNFGPNDVAGVVLTGRGLASSAQDFTSNKRLILAAIDKFSGSFNDFDNMLGSNMSEGGVSCGQPAQKGLSGIPGGSTSTTPGCGAPTSTTTSPGAPGQKAAVNTSDTRQLGSSLRRLTEFLGRIPGRKVLLYVGEGLGGLDPYQATSYKGTSLTPGELDFHEAVAAATRGNVTIYPVDPRGLTIDTTAPESFDTTTLDARADLAAIADVTGGFSLTSSNSYASAISRMIRENSEYYTIGFTSEYEKRDGRFVAVDVKVKRPGLQVRARRGYVAPLGREAATPTVSADAKMPTVTSALDNPIAVNDVVVRAVATPYKGQGSNSTVALTIEFDISKLDLVDNNGVLAGDVEVSFLAIDTKGKVHPGRRYDTMLTLKKDAAEAAFRTGVRVVSQIELPKGRYQLRIAAGGHTRAGSLVYDLEVPDFSTGLQLSGVSLTTATAPVISTFKAVDPIGAALPGPPVALRDFAHQDTVAIYAEAYDGDRRTALPTITAELRTAGGTVVGKLLQQKQSSALHAEGGAIGLSAALPLSGVQPGVYVIHVEASGTNGKDNSTDVVSRDVPIRVW
jgi:VWFA-related protein